MTERIALVSDIHFGAAHCTLSKRGTVDAFVEELLKDGRLSELILLGDVFDLWQATIGKAILESKYFMSRVGALADKITYVVGNHDHHMFMMCQESEFLERLHHSSVEESSFSPDQDFGEFLLEDLIPVGCVLDVRYARYWRKHPGPGMLFMHGHHLDPLQTFAPGTISGLHFFLAKLLQQEKYQRLLDDENFFEAALASTYESLYRNAASGELVTVENGFWKISSTLGLFKSRACRAMRFTPVQQMYPKIGSYLKRFKEMPEIFVYGHTHAADAYKKGQGVLAVNTGCWLKEKDPSVWSNPEEIPNTYATIDEAVTVRQLGNPKPIVGPFPIGKVRVLEFGGRKSIGA